MFKKLILARVQSTIEKVVDAWVKEVIIEKIRDMPELKDAIREVTEKTILSHLNGFSPAELASLIEIIRGDDEG